MAFYKNPTWNLEFPITLYKCGECAATCPFLTGIQVSDVIADAKCLKPLPDVVHVEIDGVPEGYEIKKENIKTVYCGLCGSDGVKRERAG